MIELLLGDFLPYILGGLGFVGAIFWARKSGGDARDRKRQIEEYNRNIATRKDISDALESRDPANPDAARDRLRKLAK